MPTVPVANAGPDQSLTFAERSAVILDGSGSTSDIEITGYIWREGGLEIASDIRPTIELTEGTHKITLDVSNSSGSGYDSVSITIGLEPINILNLIPEKFR